MFLLDESAPNAAKTMFESLNLQCIQGDDVESDDESHMLIDSDEEEDLTIPDTLPTKLSPCIIVDNSKGEISRCCSTEKLVPIAQLFGTWEVDASVGKKSKSGFKLHEYGVCTSHFNFDNSKIHSPSSKKQRSTNESKIKKKKCLMCNRYKIFFSRGDDCVVHSWNLVGKNIQVPCLGLKSCPAFIDIPHISSKALNSDRVRFICMECFETYGGHLHKRQGSGKS